MVCQDGLPTGSSGIYQAKRKREGVVPRVLWGRPVEEADHFRRSKLQPTVVESTKPSYCVANRLTRSDHATLAQHLGLTGLVTTPIRSSRCLAEWEAPGLNCVCGWTPGA